MSHFQNEYLVQSTVKSLLHQEGIYVRSVPLHLVAEAFSPASSFFPSARLGQLITPSLAHNIGPRYVCKIQRREQ